MGALSLAVNSAGTQVPQAGNSKTENNALTGQCQDPPGLGTATCSSEEGLALPLLLGPQHGIMGDPACWLLLLWMPRRARGLAVLGASPCSGPYLGVEEQW